MYILLKLDYEAYEYDRRIELAVSDSVEKLKEFVVDRDQTIYDQQWQENGEACSHELIIKQEYFCGTQDICSVQSYLILPIKNI